MRNKIIEGSFNFIVRHPVLIVITSFFLGIIFFVSMRSLPLKSDYIDLMPQNSEPVKKIRYLTDKLKGVGQFSIALESLSQNRDSMMKFSDALYEKIKDFPEIDFIQYKLPLDFIKDNAYLFVETNDLKEIYRRLNEKISYETWKDAPIYLNLEDEGVEFNIDDIIEKYQNKKNLINISNSQYLISNDNKMLLMLVKPNFMPTEVKRTGELIKKINDIIWAIDPKKFGNDLKISFGGTYALSFDQQNAISHDIKVTGIISIIFVFLILLLFLKNFLNSIYLVYAIIIGVFSSFGLALAVFHHINLITGFLIGILTGLDVNYGMHFLMRYSQEIKREKYLDALKISFLKTANPSFTRAITTAFSFFALSFSNFIGFSEFGLLASFGIVVTLISTYFVVTAALLIVNKYFRKNKKIKIKTFAEQKKISKSGKILFRRIIYGVSLALIIITLVFSAKLKDLEFEYNSKNLEVKNQESIRVTEDIQKKFNISTDPAIFYTYDRSEEKDFYESVLKVMKKKDSLVGSIVSISGILPEEKIQREKIKWVKLIGNELRSLPEKSIKDPKLKDNINLIKKISGKAKIIGENDLPDAVKRRLILNDQGKPLYITQIFPKKILFNTNEMKAYVNEVKTIKSGVKEYQTTGLHILYVFLIDTILKESRIFIIIVFLVIWLFVFIDLRSFRASFVTLVPLIFGVIWLLEIMAVFGIKFNIMNIIVLQTVLGTGVGSGVYLYHRYKNDKDLYNVLKYTGFANFGMSITIVLGWSVLFFAQYIGLRTMGFIGVIGILTTFLASITIMPALILILESFDNKKR